MAEVPQSAERLAIRARRSSDRGDYQNAIDLQLQAVEIRKRELDELDRNSPTLEDERKEAAHNLSDYWGRLGGIYRRAGQISAGIDAYHHGMEIERDFRLDDSYNLTNWLVLQLLDDPARLPALASQIDDAIATVDVQVKGPRSDQWWAWADFGLLCLLGRQPRGARDAYEHFQETGPRKVDYGPVLAVLDALRDQFKSAEPELAGHLSDAIEQLKSARAAL
jgi:tetratricopeptide (TPR) repeat protein